MQLSTVFLLQILRVINEIFNINILVNDLVNSINRILKKYLFSSISLLHVCVCLYVYISTSLAAILIWCRHNVYCFVTAWMCNEHTVYRGRILYLYIFLVCTEMVIMAFNARLVGKMLFRSPVCGCFCKHKRVKYKAIMSFHEQAYQ